MYLRIIITGFIATLVAVQVSSLTVSQEVEIRQTLKELIENSAAPAGPPGPGGQPAPTIMTFIPGFVRLSFHDCVGTCDGCINLLNDDNAGLETYITPLERLYVDEGYAGVISYADLFALAGVVAVEMGAEKAGEPLTIPFRWGRKDCPTAPFTDEMRTLPNSLGGLDHVLNFFNNEFGFNAQEVTALMGAHTLGRATVANSGYRGPWVRAQDTLDNDYYRVLKQPWGQSNVNTPKFQWNARSAGVPIMMLNTDMCLEYQINVNEATGESACPRSNDCQRQAGDTHNFVEEYSTNQDLWLDDFEAVFIKMIEHVADDVLLAQPTTTTTTTTTTQAPPPTMPPTGGQGPNPPPPGGRNPPPPGGRNPPPPGGRNPPPPGGRRGPGGRGFTDGDSTLLEALKKAHDKKDLEEKSRLSLLLRKLKEEKEIEELKRLVDELLEK